MARLRSAPGTQQPTTTATQTKRQALKEKTNTTRAKVPVYENDGDTEGLVKDARPRRGRAKAAVQAEDEFIMAGGLGQASSDDKTSKRNAPPPTTDELVKSDGPPPPTAKANRRPPPRMTRKTVRSEADSNVLDGIKKRMQETARTQAAAGRKQSALAGSDDAGPSSESLPTKPPPRRKSGNPIVERSEFSISPSPPPPGKLNTVNKQRSSLGQPGSALRSHGTPAVESSILALKNFKRRPRQPSMLQMVQQQRTASARPSLVHAHTTDHEDVYDLDIDDDDVEDFEPEGEGTPLHVSRKPQPAKANSKTVPKPQKDATAVTSASAKRKRKSDDVDLSTSALDALKAKRRRSSPAQHNANTRVSLQRSLSAHETSPARQVSSTPQFVEDVQVNNSFSSSTPPTEQSSPVQNRPSYELDDDEEVVVPSTEQEEDQLQYVPLDDLEEPEPEQDVNGTMAEPASSSPEPFEPPVATQRTDIMADPLTQLSPPRQQRVKPKAKANKKKPAPVTTAALQDLLPKRRQPLKPRHRKSEYDIDSASENDDPLDTSLLEGDEDELGGKLRRQTKSKAQARSKKGRATTVPKTKARQSKSTGLPARKSSAAPPPRKSTSTKKPTKTYGRAEATTSDKENNDNEGFESLDENDDSALPDTSLSMYEAARSKELEAAKKKFAKVDEWDMEFESMSFEEHRSSSQGWR